MQKTRYKYMIIIVLIVLVLPVGMIQSVSGDDDSKHIGDDWLMFQHDTGRTGFSSGSAPVSNNVLWKYTIDSPVRTSPAVVDHSIYFGVNDGIFYCLDAATGDLKWNQSIGRMGWSSPAVSENYVVVGSVDHTIYCLNALTGEILWTYETDAEILSSPLIVEGRVFVGSRDTACYAIDLYDGSFLWKHTTDKPIHSSPAYYQGNVLFGSGEYVYALNATTGVVDWQTYTDYNVEIKSAPVVYKDTVMIAGGLWLYKLDAGTGDKLWTYENPYVHLFGSGSPAVANDKVYIGDDSGSGGAHLYCIDTNTGDELWNISIYYTASSPVLTSDKLFVNDAGPFNQQGLWCLDLDTGVLQWSYSEENMALQSTPAIYDNKLYAGSETGMICFADTEQQLQLQISTPDSVEEHDNFEIIVTADSQPVSTVQISFGGSVSTTDANGHLRLAAPEVATDTYYKLTASKSGYLPTTVDILIQNKEILPDPQLYITSISSAVEGNEFLVMITADGTPVEDTTVAFGGSLYQTDATGQVYLTAPEVDQDTEFRITATKSGYQQASATIIIQQLIEDINVFGYIYDQNNQPLTATICVMDATDTDNTQYCTYSDQTGYYTISIADTGTYLFEIKKIGYSSTTDTLVIAAPGNIEQDFYLTKKTDSQSTQTSTEKLLQDLVDSKSDEVGGVVTVDANKNSAIELFSKEVTIAVNEITEKQVSLTVSGEQGTPGKFFAIHIHENAINAYNVLDSDIKLMFDGIELTAENHVDTVFAPSTNPVWTAEVSDTGELLIIVYSPSFSLHEITIFVESVPMLVAVLFYIFMFSLIAVFFVGIGKSAKQRK